MAFDLKQKSYQALKKILTERTSPVVAWVGAGLSSPARLPSWEKLLDELISSVKQKIKLTQPDSPKFKLERALLEERSKKNFWVCFQLIEEILGQTTYHAEIRELLDTSTCSDIPLGYSALWNAGIQGMISFNLDQFATRSYSQCFPGKVLDHFVGDQSKNLTAVLQRNRPFVGNVHGVIDNAGTWIFTHNKLTELLKDDGYIQFISGCLLSRTIFFVGVSADDVAVQHHLASIQNPALSGINHYWLTSRKDTSTVDWCEKYGIRPIVYSPHDDHIEALECLKDLAALAPSRDSIDPRPVLFSGLKPERLSHLPSPDELVSKPLEEIRRVLNSHAGSLLRSPNEDAYKAYDAFSEEYDEAIDRAWYTSQNPPKNKILGYTLEKRISQGSFGDVYEASSPEGKKVAIKLLRRDVRREPAMLQTFRRGIRSMRILKHHSIKGMIEFLDASEIPAFVVMEWIDGPDLMTAIKSRFIDDWDPILAIAQELAKIIHTAHLLPERVLHRDIRPQNVMLKDYWLNGHIIDVVVMDFDLSWHINALEKSIVANPMGFMAPEQLRQRSKTSTRSALVDSFGFGMTLYFMLTGDVPVPDQHKHKDWEDSLKHKIRTKRCNSWQSLPYRISRVIQGATQDEQWQRWDFARILGEIYSLNKALNGDLSSISIDYYAEEIAAHAQTMINYSWDDLLVAAIYKSGGLSVEIAANAPGDEIILSLQWQQTGDENWKLLPKTGAQVSERAKPSLEKHGWRGVTFEGSLGFMRVVASVTPRKTTFNPSQLAQGVDKLVATMLPKA